MLCAIQNALSHQAFELSFVRKFLQWLYIRCSQNLFFYLVNLKYSNALHRIAVFKNSRAPLKTRYTNKEKWYQKVSLNTMQSVSTFAKGSKIYPQPGEQCRKFNSATFQAKQPQNHWGYCCFLSFYFCKNILKASSLKIRVEILFICFFNFKCSLTQMSSWKKFCD